ncbi:MAG: HigA family addiction module antitoxin [Mariprofundaceae bacterium]|nr:HigA family addiction module antitoxin [Mariprofundaceae bacterium]
MNNVSEPIRPGKHFSEFLEETGVTAYRLARETGMPQTRIGNIINKGRSITADTAMRLGRFFGTTAQFWMNLQTAYDLRIAEIRHGEDYSKITSIAA